MAPNELNHLGHSTLLPPDLIAKRFAQLLPYQIEILFQALRNERTRETTLHNDDKEIANGFAYAHGWNAHVLTGILEHLNPRPIGRLTYEQHNALHNGTAL